MSKFRKGFLFSVTAVVLAFAVITLIGNYRLFLSQIEQDKYKSLDIQVQFLYIASGVAKILDVSVNIDNTNATTTFVNISDRLVTDIPYNNSLTAFEDMINNHIHDGHDIITNFSSFKNLNSINFTGINMAYGWGNFTKNNATAKFFSSGNNSFVKKYVIQIDNVTTFTMALTTQDVVSGDLPVIIRNSTKVFYSGSVDRTVANNFTLTATPGQTVDITVGWVNNTKSSMLVSSREKIFLNTSIQVNQGEVV